MDWDKALEKKVADMEGQDKGTNLGSYHFPKAYKDYYSVEQALLDISFFKRLHAINDIDSKLYHLPHEVPNRLRFRLYQFGDYTPLSDVLPIIESLGLKTYNVDSFHVTGPQGQSFWVNDFDLFSDQENIDIPLAAPLFQEAFKAIFLGLSENDGFNKLIIRSFLSWREVMLIRAYVNYLIQVRFRYPPKNIERTLLKNLSLVNELIHLFKTIHNPIKITNRKTKIRALEESVLNRMNAVTNLEDDLILRRFFELIHATLRTNYFKNETEKQEVPYLSIKLDARKIPELPLPTPLYEIFVYSPRFEAIHLRNTKVARGGIRWSDRLSDFRTEILSLMKAQIVKNAVIVPSGAKGGFVVKCALEGDALKKEVVACYELFIRGMLDLTDNIIDNTTVSPPGVIVLDDPDPYLVVAADKGTATFSDLANAISKEYHFWLGDAFATGGSEGYDHKKIGITARGAWESIKRHFCEQKIDVMQHSFTMVGIGDMSGDVFGNGSLYTDKIKLLAAFDHRNIFVDPNPDPERSFKERQRLFRLPTSSWEDYNKTLISTGGGVFSRSQKKIVITKEMKVALGIEENELTPNGFIRAILKAPVELLYNGGIGTYVKATDEINSEVGDKTNDYCRINASDIRAKVVGEGGNLGFTQRARVEYALKGGLIFSDFIDNSGGVDCSDHEVNLKILMDKEVAKGRITLKERNTLLASLTEEVAHLVLKDNYLQSLSLSYSAHIAPNTIILYTEYIKELEQKGLINRVVDCLPSEKILLERKSLGIGLMRPELATVLSYTKIDLKQEILKSKLPDDPNLFSMRASAFPDSIRERYRDAIETHPLMRDITATQLANKIVNKMGATYVYCLQMESGSSVEEILRAYLVSINVFETDKLKQLIESLDHRIPYKEQYNMLKNIRNLLNLSTRWFLQQENLEKDYQSVVEHYSLRIKSIEPWIPELMGGVTKQYLQSLMDKFAKAGLPDAIARRIATYRAIYTALNIIKVASTCDFGLIITAKVYFSVGEKFRLLWFRDKLAHDNQEGHWNTLARLNLRDELDVTQRRITIAIIQSNPSEPNVDVLLDSWLTKNSRIIERWTKLLETLHRSASIDYAMIFIVLRELLRLIPSSTR